MICPVHKTKMEKSNTKFGWRYSCSWPDCDYVGWTGGTPANKETRDARQKAHSCFDALWKTGKLKRKKAYKKLAHYLDLPIKDTHIRFLNLEQCGQVLEFVVTQNLSI